MGYFNFAYKLMRMYSMLGFFYRRHKKLCKILVIILLVLLTFHYLSVNGYCAQSDSTYTTDTSYLILSEYNDIVQRFVLSFNKFYGTDTTYTNRCNEFFQLLRDGKYCYFYNDIDGGRIYVGTYTYNSSYTIGDGDLQYNSYLNVPSTYYHVSIDFKQYLIDNRNYLGEVGVNNAYRDIPQILFMKTPKDIIDCMIKAGYGYSNNQDIIDIKELLEDQNQSLESIDNSLQDMTSEEVEEGVVDIPEININDPTENGFNNIYTSVINYLGFDYATNHTYWTFSIPFINKNVTYMARSNACCI